MKNIYDKLNSARVKFHTLQLKKTGLNKFAGYSYFELGDFLVPAMKTLSEFDLCAYISFGKELATMRIVDIVDPACFIEITSPMSTAALKGCHEVQNLGAVQTYLRRYLWVAALEIVEHDALDSSQPISTSGVSKISGKDAALEDFGFLTADRKTVVRKCAKNITDLFNSDDLIGAYEEYISIIENDEKSALWGFLPSNIRSALKRHGKSLEEEKV